jgi:hypothetical protein
MVLLLPDFVESLPVDRLREIPRFVTLSQRLRRLPLNVLLLHPDLHCTSASARSKSGFSCGGRVAKAPALMAL